MRSCCEAQAGLGLASILWPQPPESWDCRRDAVCPAPASAVFLYMMDADRLPGPEALPPPSPFPSASQTAAHSFEHSDGSVAAFQVALSMQKSSRGDSGKVRRKRMQLPSILQRGQEKT